MFVNTIPGESGTRWVVDERQPAALPRRGTPFRGWEEGHEERQVWVQRVLGGEIFEDDHAHLLRAYEVGQLEEVRTCPFIRRVLDKAGTYDLYLIQEWAETVLNEALRERSLVDGEAETILANVTAAIRALHRAGYVHSDVRTDNILCVGGTWKLADLGAAVPIGAEIAAWPKDKKFVLPSVLEDRIAVPEMDFYGLDRVLDEIASAAPSRVTNGAVDR